MGNRGGKDIKGVDRMKSIHVYGTVKEQTQ